MLLPIIGTIGLFGNVVTMVVLTRRGMRSSTNAYLTALAIADFIYLVCVFWLSLKHYKNSTTPISPTATAFYAFYAYTWPYSLWLTDATSKSSELSRKFTIFPFFHVSIFPFLSHFRLFGAPSVRRYFPFQRNIDRFHVSLLYSLHFYGCFFFIINFRSFPFQRGISSRQWFVNNCALHQ